MQRIVRIHEFGGPEVLRVESGAPPYPSKDQVVVDIEAIGLNRAEMLYRTGNYVVKPELPARVGSEAVGKISAIGPEVKKFRVGDRVAVFGTSSAAESGVYADWAAMSEAHVVSVPHDIPAQDLIGLEIAYGTAAGALYQMVPIQSGQTVLVTAASSSVGLAVIQVAKHLGARVIATTRTPQKKARLLEFGADHVIVTNEEEITTRALALTEGRGVDVVFDMVAGAWIPKLLEATSSLGGQYLLVGVLDEGTFSGGKVPGLSIPSLFGRRIGFYGYHEVLMVPERFERVRRYVLDGYRSGAFRPVIDRVFSLDEVVEAHKYMEKNQHFGKIVVKP